MATKLAVPRPVAIEKVQPQEIALDTDDLVEEDNTEPTASPPVLPGILIGAPAFEAAPIPPPPISSSTLLGPAVPPREIAMSHPSEYELESRRKSSPPVAVRRKELTKYVASAVGVAWFICTCAIGETALRSFIDSMH